MDIDFRQHRNHLPGPRDDLRQARRLRQAARRLDTQVRQLNAQVIVSYEPKFKNVYYRKESCCGFVGFFNLNAAKTRSCVSERREMPVTGRSA